MMGKSKKREFQGIIDKVHSIIKGWRAKILTQVGRLVLIKSVTAALPSYAMSTFLLPMSFCNELDKIFKNFWWGFPAKKSRNLSLKAWDSLCIPKLLGGLGLRKMREVNLALVTKLGWKLLTKLDCLWVSQLHCKYLNSFTFLSPLPFLPLPHGYGKASWNLFLLFPKELVTKSIALSLSLFGALVGFPPSLHSFPHLQPFLLTHTSTSTFMTWSFMTKPLQPQPGINPYYITSLTP